MGCGCNQVPTAAWSVMVPGQPLRMVQDETAAREAVRGKRGARYRGLTQSQVDRLVAQGTPAAV